MFDNVRRVTRQLVAYGTADVMVLVVNFLLLPIYTRVLSPREYGALAMLLVCEAFLKVVNRWGLDQSFLRLYYDQPDEGRRKVLATTIAIFIAAANGAIALLLLAAAAPVNRLLFSSLDFVTAYRLLVVNNFAGAFLFLPLNLLRIEERSRLFASLTFLRSFGTVVARLILVVGFRMSVLGLVLSDVIITALLLLAMAGTFRRMLAWAFSPALLREAMAFGLPHVPHGLLSQTMSMVDRFVLGMYMPLQQVGIYLIGATVAGVVKFYPVAFEAAWMPFAFDSLRRRDAPALFARMGTYAFTVLALSAIALAALAPPVIQLVLPGDYRAAMPLVPLLAAGLAVQSLAWFPMTSVNVSKRTRIYPIVTAIGAAVSVAANLLLIPSFGMRGAALALLASQIVTTAVTVVFAQRAYRIPYEGLRLAKVVVVSAGAYAAMAYASPPSLVWTIVARVLLLGLFPLGLLAARFFEPHEWAEIRKAAARLAALARPQPIPAATTDL
ncbi:MAG TPA: oligosaccharide flippase family protein [Vicinamibacterales bacterium]|jgi:O-antigen/teichoic acid export membrane protein|nr:oligosaccharide flippase family protein [Vicinamibacterales bacterium]